MFPEGWKMPSLSLTQFINLFLCGDRDAGVPPLRMVKTDDMKDHFTRHRQQLFEMKFLMFHVKRAAMRYNVWERRGIDWTIEKCVKMYDHIYHLFRFPTDTGRKRRHAELSWRTVRKILAERKGKLMGETVAVEYNSNIELVVE